MYMMSSNGLTDPQNQFLGEHGGLSSTLGIGGGARRVGRVDTCGGSGTGSGCTGRGGRRTGCCGRGGTSCAPNANKIAEG